MSGRPELDLVALGGGEAHVARAQAHDTVVQSEVLQDVFGVCDEAFQLVVRGRGFDELDQGRGLELPTVKSLKSHIARLGRRAAKSSDG